MSKIEVDAIDKQSGSTLTLGGSGTAVTLACGATQTGFGREGSVNWQTSIKTATFTAASGEGYFCNTAGGAFTVNLPSSPSVGDIVAIKDYSGTFDTENLTIGRGGSNMNGSATDSVRDTGNESLTLVYADATKGWLAVEEGNGYVGETFIQATGGTITTSGNDKIHTFTGPGTFCVSALSGNAANNAVAYMVVAGGGGSGACKGGGSGAGGFREGTTAPIVPYTASPLVAPAGVTVTASPFPITVGAGGTGAPTPGTAASGSNSIFSTITSAGGGRGADGSPGADPALNGGSGGGGSRYLTTAGNGNTPPVSPPQGNNGGAGTAPSSYEGSGGGGAGAVGAVGGTTTAGAGGAGVTSSINATPTARAGGGGGGSCAPGNSGAGGTGGGGAGAGGPGNPGVSGTANTGGGGGGGPNYGSCGPGGSGGSGIVIIRYKFQ